MLEIFVFMLFFLIFNLYFIFLYIFFLVFLMIILWPLGTLQSFIVLGLFVECPIWTLILSIKIMMFFRYPANCRLNSHWSASNSDHWDIETESAWLYLLHYKVGNCTWRLWLVCKKVFIKIIIIINVLINNLIWPSLCDKLMGIANF